MLVSCRLDTTRPVLVWRSGYTYVCCLQFPAGYEYFFDGFKVGRWQIGLITSHTLNADTNGTVVCYVCLRIDGV